jgi:EF hand
VRGLAVALLCVGFCVPLCAQDDRLLRKPFRQFDRNKDGLVTEKEFPGNPKLFRLMDKNHDRQVTFDEYKISTLARRYLAAVRLNRDEPRKRVDISDLATRRLNVISRFDKNRDGKIQRSEWAGSPEGFRSLDLDGNGIVDRRDRARANSEAEILEKALNRIPTVRTRVPNSDVGLKAHDKDRDGTLSRDEAAKTPYARFFAYADRNGDALLEGVEINRLVDEINAIIDARDTGYGKPRAPIVPFRAWDKNNDGRIDLKEWVDNKNLFKRMDINRDAAVTPDEVLRYKKSFEGGHFMEKFDLNGDNRVSRTEFAGTRAAFDRADRNGDGFISNRDR